MVKLALPGILFRIYSLSKWIVNFVASSNVIKFFPGVTESLSWYVANVMPKFPFRISKFVGWDVNILNIILFVHFFPSNLGE